MPIPFAAIFASTAAAIQGYGAIQSNRAVSGAARGEARAAGEQALQVSNRSLLSQIRARRSAQLAIARLRVIQAESGSAGGSFESLIRFAAQEGAMDAAIEEENRRLSLGAIYSGASSNIGALMARRVSPLLAAAGGALQGAVTGLQIQGTNEAAGALLPEQPDYTTGLGVPSIRRIPDIGGSAFV